MIFMKVKELASYLTVESKIFIQSYAAKMNCPAEEVGIPLLPQESNRLEEKVTLI